MKVEFKMSDMKVEFKMSDMKVEFKMSDMKVEEGMEDKYLRKFLHFAAWWHEQFQFTPDNGPPSDASPTTSPQHARPSPRPTPEHQCPPLHPPSPLPPWGRAEGVPAAGLPPHRHHRCASTQPTANATAARVRP